jgi:hypothetical protein
MNAIERTVLRWRAAGIGPNPGASAETIKRLEERIGTPLPDDVRQFFSLADGIEDGFTDGYFLSFWSIEKILREDEDMTRTVYQRDPRDVPIADFLIRSWFVFLRRLEVDNLAVWVEGAAAEFPSLLAFFEAYERDPDSLGLVVEQS